VKIRIPDKRFKEAVKILFPFVVHEVIYPHGDTVHNRPPARSGNSPVKFQRFFNGDESTSAGRPPGKYKCPAPWQKGSRIMPGNFLCGKKL
jgi:hypothetical protein